MRILVFGKSGQLAQEFKRLIPAESLLQTDRLQASFLNPLDVIKVIKEYKPTHIINTSAYTAVDKAESEKAQAMSINGDILGVIGEQAKLLDAFVFHFSTDYVFNGNKTAEYTEVDTPDPINFYGITKLAGENNLINSGCKNLIFRISWVYSEFGSNFLKTILKLAQSEKVLKVVADQVGAPTSAKDIASAVFGILHNAELSDKTGIYHLAPKGRVSWHGYAQKIIELAKLNPTKYNIKTDLMVPILSEEMKTQANRPKNSCLSSVKLAGAFGFELPRWEESLELVFKTL